MDLQTKNQDLDIIRKYLNLIYYTNNLCIKYPKSENLHLQLIPKEVYTKDYATYYMQKKNFIPKINLIT